MSGTAECGHKLGLQQHQAGIGKKTRRGKLLDLFHDTLQCNTNPKTTEQQAGASQCVKVPTGTYVFTLWPSVLSMRLKAWLAARVSLRLARLPRTASSAQRSRRLRSMCAAAQVLLAHADVTKNIKYLSMHPKLRHLMVLQATRKHQL